MKPEDHEKASFPVGAVPSGVWEEGQRRRADELAGIFMSQLASLTPSQREIIFEYITRQYCIHCGHIRCVYPAPCKYCV